MTEQYKSMLSDTNGHDRALTAEYIEIAGRINSILFLLYNA
jgi:hypothetical protein